MAILITENFTLEISEKRNGANISVQSHELSFEYETEGADYKKFRLNLIRLYRTLEKGDCGMFGYYTENSVKVSSDGKGGFTFTCIASNFRNTDYEIYFSAHTDQSYMKNFIEEL